MWVALTSRHQTRGHPSRQANSGEGAQDSVHLEVFGRLECSFTQSGHFTAEAERSRQHCSRQHCGVYGEHFDARRPFHCGGGSQPSVLRVSTYYIVVCMLLSSIDSSTVSTLQHSTAHRTHHFLLHEKTNTCRSDYTLKEIYTYI